MVSVVIPALNEEKFIEPLLAFLCNHEQKASFEVIVVDGGSKDQTQGICEQHPIKVLHASVASRAHQMNLGARNAKGDILYFVHADSIPPKSFVQDIEQAVADKYLSGCYRFKFRNKPNPLLHINDFFTRFPFKWCRGGDQTFYIQKELFYKMGGFNEEYVIMEDYEMLDRVFSKTKFKLFSKPVEVSSRKYQENSYLKVQLANLKAMRMYRSGEAPERIKQEYRARLS